MPYSATILHDSPIRYYRLDETSGTVANDLGSQAQNGTLHGTITLSRPGLSDSTDTAMLLDGTTGYITAASSGLPTGNSPWSIEGWVNLPSATLGGNATLIYFGTNVFLYHDNQATPNSKLYVNGTTITGLPLTLGNTYYLSGTYDGVNATLYVGDPFTGILHTYGPSAATASLVATSLYIGNDTSNNYLPATIDEVAIYSTALSSAQVSAHYAAGAKVHIIHGIRLFPDDNIFNARVDSLPVLPGSAAFISAILADASGFQMNVSTPAGGTHGKPYNLVTNATPTYTPTLTYPGTSYTGPFPVPASPLIESDSSDFTMICFNTDTGMLYEIGQAVFTGSALSGSSAWKWDMSSNAMPPEGSTANSAAGLPTLPGLVMYDEVASGVISHALYLVTPNPSGQYIWPAVHADGSNLAEPSEGMRLRLKASFNISSYSAANQTILTAMKQYGLILTDKGAANSLKLQGVPDTRWNDTDLAVLNSTLDASYFEVVNQSLLQVSPTTMAASLYSFPGDNAYSARVKSDTPMLYYRLDEASGLLAYDASGNGYNGTYAGSIALGQSGALAGTTDTAIAGDGTQGYILAPYPLRTGGWTAITLEWWWNLIDNTGVTATTTPMTNSHYSSNIGWEAYVSTTDQTIHFWVGKGGSTQQDIGSVHTATFGAWQHVVISADVTATKIYLNGVLDKTGPAMPTLLESGYKIMFCQNNYYQTYGWLHGKFDEAAIYPYALSATQVLTHYLIGRGATLGTYTVMIGGKVA